MKTNHENQDQGIPRSGIAVGIATAPATRSPLHRLNTRLVVGGVLLLAAIAVTVMLSSCGSEKASMDTVSAGDGADAVAAQHVGFAQTSEPATSPSTMPEPGDAKESKEPPPDLSASATDSLLTPGTTVEVVARTTGDATRVVLRDGWGAPVPLVYDVDGKVWTASYRVPLHPHGERLGLSVTAQNDHGRWRRVWVFLNVAVPAPPDAAESDSSESDC